MPEIAPKEERSVLWVRKRRFEGKIRCLRKLEGFDEGGDASLDLTHVAVAVIGLDLHIRNARTLDCSCMRALSTLKVWHAWSTLSTTPST